MLSIDFVVELLESSGHNAVITVVDTVSKRVHFISMHTMCKGALGGIPEHTCR